MSNSIVYNDTYIPSTIVRHIHNLPHLNYLLNIQSNTWDITSDSYWNNYSKSVLTLPLIIGFSGLLLFFILLCILSCCNKEEVEDIDEDEQQQQSHNNRNVGDNLINGDNNLTTRMIVDDEGFLYDPSMNYSNNNYTSIITTTVRKNMNIKKSKYYVVIIIVVIFSAIIVNQFLIFGNNFINHGITYGSGDINNIKDLFVDLNNDGNNLLTYGDNLDTYLSSACFTTTCTTACTYSSYLQEYNNYINDYLDYIYDLPDQCNNIHNYLYLYGSLYKNILLWLFYGLITISIISYIYILNYNNNKIINKISFCFVNILMCLLLITCTILMIVLVS
jgi:hypothetical protein